MSKLPVSASMNKVLPNITRLNFTNEGCVWVHSDLQLSDPSLARQVLKAAVDDVLSLGLPVTSAWCLGDALCGRNEAALEEVANTTIEQMERTGVPVCYVMGNHEMDLRRAGIARYPLFERALSHPQWHTMERLEDLYFARMIHGCLVVFMGDHAASGTGWWTSHNKLMDRNEDYPHKLAAYTTLKNMMADSNVPVIIASHYAFPGGQRPGALIPQLLPLPDNVRLHLFGHAHIGDMVHNQENPYQRSHKVAGQTIRQFNISALETRRSAGSHSAFLHFKSGRPDSLKIRCHLEHKWLEEFDLNQDETGKC